MSEKYKEPQINSIHEVLGIGEVAYKRIMFLLALFNIGGAVLFLSLGFPTLAIIGAAIGMVGFIKDGIWLWNN